MPNGNHFRDPRIRISNKFVKPYPKAKWAKIPTSNDYGWSVPLHEAFENKNSESMGRETHSAEDSEAMQWESTHPMSTRDTQQPSVGQNSLFLTNHWQTPQTQPDTLKSVFIIIDNRPGCLPDNPADMTGLLHWLHSDALFGQRGVQRLWGRIVVCNYTFILHSWTILTVH
jgi:hypothetical protein